MTQKEREQTNELRATFGLPPLPEEYRTGRIFFRDSLDGKQMILNKNGAPLESFDLNRFAVIEPSKEQ